MALSTHTSQKYELYLKKGKAIQQQCLQKIQKKFHKKPKRVYPKTSDDNLKNFFEIKLQISGNKWDIAMELANIEGVIEVDPIGKFTTIFNQPIQRDNDDYSQDTKWNHKLTRFPEAIKYSIEEGKLNNKLGTDVTIVQLDTGYTNHPEIKKINKKGKNFIKGESADDALDVLDRNFLEQPGHGTSTAGIIIGTDTNLKYDQNNGVFPYVDVIPYRISPSVVLLNDARTVAEAIREAVDSGSDIITMSMGGVFSKAWQEAVKYAFNKGVIFVAAAGNQVRTVVWPARYNHVIAVAAVNVNKLPWEGSSRGKKVDISAPGENVFVAKVPQENQYFYTYGSGTSYATPHVAAAAAMWLNHYKIELNTSFFINNPSEKVKAFRFALSKSANIPVEWDSRHLKKFGAGILDARKILEISPNDYLIEEQKLEFIHEYEDDITPDLPTKELIFTILSSKSETTDDLFVEIRTNCSDKASNTFGTLVKRKRSILTKIQNSGFSHTEQLTRIKDLLIDDLI